MTGQLDRTLALLIVLAIGAGVWLGVTLFSAIS
jgi:hypothetical protein